MDEPKDEIPFVLDYKSCAAITDALEARIRTLTETMRTAPEDAAADAGNDITYLEILLGRLEQARRKAAR